MIMRVVSVRHCMCARSNFGISGFQKRTQTRKEDLFLIIEHFKQVNRPHVIDVCESDAWDL